MAVINTTNFLVVGDTGETASIHISLASTPGLDESGGLPEVGPTEQIMRWTLYMNNQRVGVVQSTLVEAIETGYRRAKRFLEGEEGYLANEAAALGLDPDDYHDEKDV